MRTLVILIILVVCSSLGGGAYAYYYFGGFGGEAGNGLSFIDAYGSYQEVATKVEELTHAPGVGNNNDRAELLRLLTQILTGELDATQREGLAREAFVHIDNLRREVDAAQVAQAELYGSLDDLETAAQGLKAAENRKEALALVVDARKAAELSARITSSLAEINDQTYAIITRILEEQGNLSFEHVTLINDATAVAEKRFGELTTLYGELVALRTVLTERFQALAPRLV